MGVLGAGPAGFGFVKRLIDRQVLPPSPDRPPIRVGECGEKPGIRSVYGAAFWPADPVIFPDDPKFFVLRAPRGRHWRGRAVLPTPRVAAPG